MKKIFTILTFFFSAISFGQSTTLVVSQLYGAGGNTGAVYNADYVELHNVSTVDQSIAGFSVQYASSAASTTANWAGKVKLPSVTIPAGGYYLIQMTAAGANGIALPTPDFTASPAVGMSGTAGRIALSSDTTLLVGCPTGANIIDFVGYGTAATCSEGSPTATLSATSAAFRNNFGCSDNNTNSTDFTVGSPSPRNSSTPVYICGVTPPPAALFATVVNSFGNICITSSSTPKRVVISGTSLTAGTVTVGPLNGFSFSTDSLGTYTSTLSITVSSGTLANTNVYIQFAPTALGSYNGNAAVSGGGAPSINIALAGTGVDASTVTTGNATAITTSGATLAATSVQGCAATTAYGIEYSTTSGFTPGTGTQVPGSNLSGSGFSVPLSGLNAATTYYYVAYIINANGTIYGSASSFTTLAVSGAVNGVVISQIFTGGGSSTGTYTSDYVELHNNTSVSQNLAGCKVMYGSTSSTTFSAVFTFGPGPTSEIPAGGYLLLATAPGTGLAALPIPADTTFALSLSSNNGKVIFGTSNLLNTTNFAGQTAGAVIDFVGYGTANESEGGSAVGALSQTTAAFRNNNGCDDTNNNLADFTISTPSPRNKASQVNICSSLPVKLYSFEVVKQGANVSLVWKTAQESNSKEFVIERSADGKNNWTKIVIVEASVNSTTNKTYFTTDANPLSGTNYYRVKSVDMSGAFEYSSIKMVQFIKSTSLSVSPNPATDRVVIGFDNPMKEMKSIEVIDATGKVVATFKTSGNQIQLQTAGYNRGLYFIRTTGSNTMLSKLILQ